MTNRTTFVAVADGDSLSQGYFNELFYATSIGTSTSWFGGEGDDGSLTTSGNGTFTRGKVYQYSSLTISSGDTYTPTGGTNTTDPIVIKVSGNCSIEGTIDLSASGAAGGAGANGNDDNGSAGTGIPEIIGGGGGGE
jgi:hypothetical protein